MMSFLVSVWSLDVFPEAWITKALDVVRRHGVRFKVVGRTAA